MPRIRKQEVSYVGKAKVWKIGVYVRLSKDDGNDESLSVTNQKKINVEYLENFFEDEHIVVDFYVDDGRSGTDNGRPEFQRMLADVKNGRINCVLCKTLARAFRNYADQGHFLEEVFPLYNTRFISIGSPALDTYLTPDAIVDGMEVPITGLMNDRYAARTSQDIRRTFDTKRRNGEFIGAFAPYGYKKNPKNKNHLIIDDEAADVVRDIFNWYVNESMSKLGIVKHLNELGVMTPTDYKHSKGLNLKTPNRARNDGKWGISTIVRILQNKVYIGTMVQGQQRVISYKVKKAIAMSEDEWFVVENTHDPIVDRELFDKAQSLAKRDTRTAPKKKKVYLFSGFMRCPDCGRSMRRKVNTKKNKSGVKEYIYYTCTTHAFKGKDLCTSHSIRHDVLTDAVLKAVQMQIATVANVSDVIAEINQQSDLCVSTSSSRLKKQLMEKKAELEKLVHATDSLYLDWKSGDITRADYVRMKECFEGKSGDIKQMIASIEVEIDVSSQGVNEDSPYLIIFLRNQNIKELSRSILIELVDTIYIHEGNEITIKFKFADQYQRIVDFIEDNQG